MATFHSDNPNPSRRASRRLHPAAEAAETAVRVDDAVLVEIAAGLARTVPAAGTGPGRAVLLATPAYEAAIETVEVGGCQLAVGADGHPVSVAVVSGRLVAWAADGGSHLLSPGGLFTVAGGDRVQLVNVGTERAVLVSVRALPVAEIGLDNPGDGGTFAPCPSLAG